MSYFIRSLLYRGLYRRNSLSNAPSNFPSPCLTVTRSQNLRSLVAGAPGPSLSLEPLLSVTGSILLQVCHSPGGPHRPNSRSRLGNLLLRSRLIAGLLYIALLPDLLCMILTWQVPSWYFPSQTALKVSHLVSKRCNYMDWFFHRPTASYFYILGSPSNDLPASSLVRQPLLLCSHLAQPRPMHRL